MAVDKNMAAMWLVMWVYVNADVDEMLYGSGKWITGLAVKLDEPATMWKIGRAHV